MVEQFKSDVPGTEKKQLTYEDVAKATFVDPTIAETVFARVSRTKLPKLIDGTTHINDPEPGDVGMWIDQRTCVVPLKPEDSADDSVIKHLSDTMAELVEAVAEAVNRTLEGGHKSRVWFIEPLWVRIQRVDSNLYSFSVKQKWAVR